jgi:hypothetical protein
MHRLSLETAIYMFDGSACMVTMGLRKGDLHVVHLLLLHMIDTLLISGHSKPLAVCRVTCRVK